MFQWLHGTVSAWTAFVLLKLHMLLPLTTFVTTITTLPAGVAQRVREKKQASSVLDYIHVGDAVVGLVHAYRQAEGTTVYIGNGVPLPVNRVVDTVLQAAAKNASGKVGAGSASWKVRECHGNTLHLLLANRDLTSQLNMIGSTCSNQTTLLDPSWHRQLQPYVLPWQELPAITRNHAASKRTPQNTLPPRSVFGDQHQDWWALRNNVTALIEARADQGYVVVTMATHLAGFWAMMCSQLHALQTSEPRNWVIIAPTDKALQACREAALPCWNASSIINATGIDYDSDKATRPFGKTWTAMSWPKPYAIMTALELNLSVVYMDGDVGVKPGALANLMKHPKLFQLNIDGQTINETSPGRANSGFAVVHPHKLTQQFMRDYVKEVMATKVVDQNILQNKMQKLHTAMSPDEVKAFARVLRFEHGYHTGCHKQNGDLRFASATGHTNCLGGYASKIAWLQHKNLWALPMCGIGDTMHEGAGGPMGLEELDVDVSSYAAAKKPERQRQLQLLLHCACATLKRAA
jgi:hypothetical protein